MARKTTTKNAKNPSAKLAIDDTTAGLPKVKASKPKHVTLEEALAESGETLEELTAPAADEAPVRPAGTSNLACTIRSHRKNYAPMLHPNGKKTQNNGDEVAVLLLSIPLDKLKAYSASRFDGKAYDHLNPGHARMCIGNNLRAAFKKGEVDVVEWLVANQPKQDDAAE